MYAHAAIFQKHFKPKEVNALLLESVRQFPANLSLLLIRHYFSRRAGITDRLRQVDSKTGEQREATSTQSVIPCMFNRMRVVLDGHPPCPRRESPSQEVRSETRSQKAYGENAR